MRLPSEPVTVTVYEPAFPEQDSVEVPLVAVLVRVILFGESLHVRPVEGEIVADSATLPARP
jgi:hypothetical protein